MEGEDASLFLMLAGLININENKMFALESF